ncbi:sugar transferase [Enterococcus dispar]|uniref:Bacterial sugar transferase domain-containing protein n=1 Tax=Enterococcus dispar ATCC 51266 TaxID=1139219 RepID=S1P1G1_9ENTE|nr:sugar transferase [Enterococcus dispar]EOT41452.1 hypothetical protein OMK_01628 [Enterococcus dispar ATCC 51266]EOW86914.1 hypothetical protein I569_02278 [Enterococcus dispar ATCC 51266]
MKKVKIYESIIKRYSDLLFSILLLLVLLPILIVIAISVKVTSKGPIFFKQERIGLQGKTFEIYKFRTMCVGAENIGDGLTVKSDTDNRITKVGKFLRRTSLDELPQLINILKGEMSFVGPRPPVTYFPYKSYKNYPDWAKKRFEVRPGVTGFSQCTVRNSVSWDERIVLDNKYVERVSIKFDLKIFIMTLIKVFNSTNIYGEGK